MERRTGRLAMLLGPRRPVLSLAALYVAFGLLPLLTLAQFCLSSAQDAVRHQVSTGLTTTATTSAVATADRLSALGDLVTASANDPALAAYLSDPRHIAEGESPMQEVTQLRSSQPGVAEVLLCDRDGLPLADSADLGYLRDPTATDWFRAEVASPRTYLSAGYAPAVQGTGRAVVIAAPVRDRTGRPGGVLAAAYRLDALQTFTDQIAAAQGIGLVITDQTGAPVASSASDRPSARSSDGHGRVLTATRPVPGFGWIATATVPESQALAPLLALRSAVVGAVLLLGTVLLIGLAAQVRLAWARSRAEDALQAARDEALLLSERKSTLLAEVSHEIRTPMNGIVGMTGLLEATGLDELQRRYTAATRSSAAALLTIVDDLLDLSRIEAGRLMLRHISFDPRWLCAEVLDLMAPQAAEQGLRLDAKIAPEVPDRLAGDSGRIRQVLVNLVGNAVKYAPLGRVDVLVDLVADAAGPGGYVVRFGVRDTGDGLTPDQQERIFDHYTRCAGSGQAVEGAGLGLAISRELVAAMGGRMGVESTPGRGSRFWFTLGLAPAPGPGEAGLPPFLDAVGRAVLVADDDEVCRQVARDVLEGAGFTVDLVPDGEQAVAATRRAEYGLVLMDLRMPGLDGLAAARAIRAGRHHASPPVVAVTGEREPAVLKACREAGIQAVVGKPVDWPALVAALRGTGASERGDRTPVTAATAGGAPFLDPPPAGRIEWDSEVVADLAECGAFPAAAEAFGITAPGLAQAVASAVRAADLPALGAAAHRLAGAAATIGARSLAARCRRIERLAETGGPPPPGTATGLADEVAAAIVELSSLHSSAGSV
ncbi:hybrid sensor histidine kinase/response regulator [Kitasatospora sp. NPDC001175]|uniref:hybrid sensor histidine kinase/response regulator n=1 Tax=Kitasatospora sp. NPDC001175 TaxID=3157103 RepID=UPI003CFBE882